MKDSPSALRVVMLCQGYFPLVGGAERQITAISEELVRSEVEVHVLTRRYHGQSPVETISGVTVHRLPTPKNKILASLSFTLSALPLIRRLNPDVIHAHELFSPTTTAVIARKLYKIPVVTTIHGGGEITRLKQKMFGKTRLRIFRSHVDRFITITKEIGRQLAQEGIPESLRTWIPNGVDLEHFSPVNLAQKNLLKTRLHLPEGQLVIFTGRLVVLKRVDKLILAWKRIQQNFPTAALLIIGNGSEEGALKHMSYSDQTESNEDREGIRFIGEMQDVAPYLQASDLFVLPSSREGLSVALLEAIASGLAVIATDVGGNADLIQHQKTGLLVPGDVDVELPYLLAEAMQKLLTDEPLRIRMIQAGLERIVQSYSLDVVTKLLHELYLSLNSMTSTGLKPNHRGRSE